jgi:hypothetical protein
MNSIEILNRLLKAKGTHTTLRYQTEDKPSAAFKGTTLKRVVRGAFRSGIAFENLKEVKEAIAAGERGEVQSLPWGEWKQYPHIITHKGNDYIRIYPAVGSGQVPSTTYLVNGEEVDKDTYLTYLTESDRKKKTDPSEAPLTMSLNVYNILDLIEE